MTAKLFGMRLRAARKARGLNIEQLAEKAGISGNYLGEIERGNKLPSLDTFMRLVNELDVSADYLLKDDLKKEYYDLDPELGNRLSELEPMQRKGVMLLLEDLLDHLHYFAKADG